MENKKEQMEMLESMITDAAKQKRVRDPWSEDLDPISEIEREVVDDVAFDIILEDLTFGGMINENDCFNN